MTTKQQHKQYLRTQIQTASKEQLVLMLFDGAIRFCEQGKKALESEDIEAAHVALTRAQEVVMELLYAVDREKGGEIAENLVRLYSYSLLCLVEANMRRDKAKAIEVQTIMRELREGWAGAIEKVKAETAEMPKPATEPAPPATGPDTVALSSDTPVSLPVAKPSESPPRPKAKLPPIAPRPADLQPRLSVQG